MDELGRSSEPCVVVGVNGSGTALRAVRWAAAEAHRCRVPLRIVHAAPYALGNPGDERRAESILALAHTVATHAQSRGAHAHRVRLRASGARAHRRRRDRPAAGGRHGRSERVRRCARPVTGPRRVRRGVVPGGGRAGPGGPDVDRRAGGARPGRRRSRRGRDHRCVRRRRRPRARRLVVVHALRGPEAMLDAMAGHPASARAAAKQEITAALAPWRSRHPGVPVVDAAVDARPVSGGLRPHDRS